MKKPKIARFLPRFFVILKHPKLSQSWILKVIEIRFKMVGPKIIVKCALTMFVLFDLFTKSEARKLGILGAFNFLMSFL